MNPRFRMFFIYLVMAALAISSATGMQQCIKTLALKKTSASLSHDNKKQQAPPQSTTTCSFSPLIVEKQEAAAQPAPDF
ncbi:MAG: hypothetical protein ACO1OO_11910 [Flavisolibacter sp.]